MVNTKMVLLRDTSSFLSWEGNRLVRRDGSFQGHNILQSIFTLIYSTLLVISYPSIQNSYPTSKKKNSKKINPIYLAISKQIHDTHMFTHHAVVIPATISTLLHIILPHVGAITEEVN
jgi:hypothetical protein